MALKLGKCWLQLKNKFIVLFIVIFGSLSCEKSLCDECLTRAFIVRLHNFVVADVYRNEFQGW